MLFLDGETLTITSTPGKEKKTKTKTQTTLPQKKKYLWPRGS